MTAQTFLNGRVTLHAGDCLDRIKDIPDASIDSVVTDPPYALVSIGKRFGKAGSAPCVVPEGRSGAYARASAGFMGKTWDTGERAFAVDFWAEVYRVLKPGGHVLAFGGTRTVHRLTCAIEDAGFEIRDMVAWLYGSGFPKSQDVARGIQRRRVEDVEPVRVICRAVRAGMNALGLKSRDLVELFEGCHPRLIDHWAARDTDSQPSLPTWEQWQVLRARLALADELDAEVWRLNGRKGMAGTAWADAEIVGEKSGNIPGLGGTRFSAVDTTIREASAEAAEWQGWGTALKPALEPITFARKPLAGTVADNVLAHGTGALNISACRVGTEDDLNGGAYAEASQKQERSGSLSGGLLKGGIGSFSRPLGRWPANLIHDGSDEVVAAFPQCASGAVAEGTRDSGKSAGSLGAFAGRLMPGIVGSAGSAARFFYNAKADSDDRIGSKHPTVKPVDLMRYLVRLVTPPGGTVLDPFAGTGTTGEAAFYEGFCAVLIEREDEYRADIARRMTLAMSGPDERKREIVKAKQAGKPDDLTGTLFGFTEAAE
jgi:DNA modification methylase